MTRDCVPVSMSPYTATIFNTTISFPPMVLFYAALTLTHTTHHSPLNLHLHPHPHPHAHPHAHAHPHPHPHPSPSPSPNPDQVLFMPLPAANADALPATLMSSDSALVHDMVAVLQS